MQKWTARAAMAVTVAGLAAGPAVAHGPHHDAALPATGASAFGATSGSSVFDEPLAAAAAGPVPTTVATILSVSDFHGRLNPDPFRIDIRGQRFGGAAHLQTYFEQRAALAPNPPFLVTQGDAVGATQPVSGLLGDRPTIAVMNAMGFDADTLGNHNFDNGVAHMRDLARQAQFPYVVTNLTNPAGHRLRWTRRWTIWEVDGVKVGVIGAINFDAPKLLRPGAMEDLVVHPMAPALNAAAAELRAQGVRTIVALVHEGADPTKVGPSGPTGPLMDLAGKLEGIDLLLGDHTYWQVNQPVRGADGAPVWVMQNVPQGATFGEVKLTLDKLTGESLAVVANQFLATDDVPPDPEIQGMVTAYNEQVAEQVEEQVGSSTEPMPINDGLSEARQGSVATDAMRWATGAQLGFYQSGGLRAGLTDTKNCENAGSGPCLIKRGDVLAMLPFQDQVAQVTITGTELKQMLEHGVGQYPTPSARFPQISGFRFSYRLLSNTPRVTSAFLADGTPIRFSADESFTLVTGGFLATGGDNYPNYSGRITYGGEIASDVIAYLQAHPGLDPPDPGGRISVE